MALSANTVRNAWNISDFPPAKRTGLTVKAGSTIYKGSACGLSSGELIVSTGSEACIGFATDDYDAGDTDAEVQYMHFLFLDVTGVSSKSGIGSTVYASDDDTFSTTPGTTIIGRVHDYQNGQAIVRISLQSTGA